MADVESRRLAQLIGDSCAQGDHLRVGKLSLRAIFGFALILLGLARRPARVRIEAEVLLVIANGVAHGASLADALASSIPGEHSHTVIADRRLASADAESLNSPFAMHAPGLAPRSVWAISSFVRIGQYVRLRRAIKGELLRHSSSRLYDEYVFLAQTLRFLTAKDAVPATTRLLICDFDRHAYSYPWVWACARLGIPTVTAVHGSPSASTYLPLVAETALAWGPVQHSWFAQFAPDARAALIGRPEIPSRELVLGDVRRVIFCHSREELQPGESTRLADLARNYSNAGVECVLRLHPSAPGPVRDGWERVGEYCRIEVAGYAPLSESLVAGDFVVGVVTSALVDALVAGHPVAVLADHERPLPADIAAIAQLCRQYPFDSDHIGLLPSEYVEALNGLSQALVEVIGEESRSRIRETLSVLAQRDRRPTAEF